MLVNVQLIRDNVESAGETIFRVNDVTLLSVKIGRLKTKAVLEFVPKLATKLVHGTAAIDRKIDRTKTKSRQIIQKSGCAVKTVATFED